MLKSIFSNTRRNEDLALLILRLAGGGFMLTHGFPKLQRILEGNWKFADPIGLGPEISLVLVVFAEFICAIMLLVGFKARFASIFLMFTMLVAAFIQHGDDPWGKKEFPLLYFAIFLAVFLMGSGNHSLDGRLDKS